HPDHLLRVGCILRAPKLVGERLEREVVPVGHPAYGTQTPGRGSSLATPAPGAKLRHPGKRTQTDPDRRQEHVEDEDARGGGRPPHAPPPKRDRSLSRRLRIDVHEAFASSRRRSTMRMIRAAVSSTDSSVTSITGQPSRRWTAAAWSSSS